MTGPARNFILESAIQKGKQLLRGMEGTPTLNQFLLILAYLFADVYDSFHRGQLPEARATQMAMQVLDLEWVRHHFWECLVYNHYQPPLFSNLLMGTFYIVFESDMARALLLFAYIAGLLAFAALLRTMNLLKFPQLTIVCLALLVIFHPTRLAWEWRVFYTSWSFFALTGAIYFFVRFMAQNHVRHYAGMSALVLAVTWLDPFFHFAWGLALVAVAWGLSPVRFRPSAWAMLTVAVLLLVAVPLKNYVVFGTFGTSSGLGVVLAERSGVPRPTITEHARNGEISKSSLERPYAPAIYLDLRHAIPQALSGIQCLTTPWKDIGDRTYAQVTFNYNFYTMIPVGRELVSDFFWLVRRYPLDYARATVQQFVEFFSGTNTGFDRTIPFLKASRRGPGLSLIGIVYLLSVLGGMAYLLSPKRKPDTLEYKTFLFLMLNVGYSLLAGVLVSMFAGPQHRLPFESCYVLLTGLCLTHYFSQKRDAPDTAGERRTRRAAPRARKPSHRDRR
ncbi:MAG TPA: hypothetical protein VMS64_15550 [Candidatus Methylomirabilis sp.]|nr:hypothetical protein [Candidatus Methylomirabilis sp.]